LASFTQNGTDFPGQLGILDGEEGVGGTKCPCTAGTADTMDIVFCVVGHVVVDHHLDIFNICNNRVIQRKRGEGG